MDFLLNEEIRFILEGLYYFAGIILSISVVVAIVQLRQSKKLSQMHSKRDAAKVAVQQCNYFGKEIVQDVTHLLKLFDDKKITLLHDVTVEFSKEGMSCNTSSLSQEQLALLGECSMEMSKTMNMLEGFALMFSTGVADEDIGFLSCGRGFVRIFEQLFPIYALHRSLDDYYKGTQTMYWRWKKRIERDDLLKKYEELAKGTDFSMLRPQKKIRPIGG